MAQSHVVFFFGAACIITALHTVSGEDQCRTTCDRLYEYCDQNIGLCADCETVCHNTYGTFKDCTRSCPAWCKHVREEDKEEYHIKYHHCFEVEDAIDVDDRPRITDDEIGSGSGSGSGSEFGDSEGGDDSVDGRVADRRKAVVPYNPPVPHHETTIAPAQKTSTNLMTAVTAQITPCPKSSLPELNIYIYGGFGGLVLILVILNIAQCLFLQRMIKKDTSKPGNLAGKVENGEGEPLTTESADGKN